jgi:hypothetical protein
LDAAAVEATAGAAVCACDGVACLPAVADAGDAAGRGMECDLVVGVEVDAFVDVEFACGSVSWRHTSVGWEVSTLIGPVGTYHPAGDLSARLMQKADENTHYAGHEPQLLPGTCAKSAMIRPRL